MVENRYEVDFIEIEVSEGIIHEGYVSPFSETSNRRKSMHNLDFTYDVGLLKTSYPVLVRKFYNQTK